MHVEFMNPFCNYEDESRGVQVDMLVWQCCHKSGLRSDISAQSAARGILRLVQCNRKCS